MIFEWRLRKLLLWHFSLADIILKKTGIQEWAVRFLNGFKALHGPVFIAGDNGSITTRRRFRHPFGHYEEIGRQCFRHLAGYEHYPEKNQIVLWVYNYRRPEDVRKLKQSLKLTSDFEAARR